MPNDTPVALVTGAASGIGLATARAFAAAGYRVVLADRNDDAGRTAEAGLRAAGGEATFVHTDITRLEQVDAMVQAALSAYGRLDSAVNNAGITGPARLVADLTPEEWAEVIAVNLTGVWHCLKAEVPVMQAQGSGAIVNIASTAAFKGGRGTGAYSASKHGVLGLTKSAAIEYARSGIRINAVCPGATDTPMLERLTANNEGLRARIAKQSVLGRHTLAEEVASAVLWLCSDAASSVIGQALAVDGGSTA